MEDANTFPDRSEPQPGEPSAPAATDQLLPFQESLDLAPASAGSSLEAVSEPVAVSATADVAATPLPLEPAPTQPRVWSRVGQEVMATVQTLLSAAVYATLIVTFGFQVARVDGL